MPRPYKFNTFDHFGTHTRATFHKCEGVYILERFRTIKLELTPIILPCGKLVLLISHAD